MGGGRRRLGVGRGSGEAHTDYWRPQLKRAKRRRIAGSRADTGRAAAAAFPAAIAAAVVPHAATATAAAAGDHAVPACPVDPHVLGLTHLLKK